MVSVFENKEDCCGCTACASICPKNAITMTYDDCGFSYPKIDQEACIDCGACQKTCAFCGENQYARFESCYVVKHLSQDVVNESRSGGAFTAISDSILRRNGVIYGALLDSKLFVRHARAINTEQRNALRKSKYVQSNLEGIFEQVASDLLDDRLVLFTGTGCQCDGLKGYLQIKNISLENLILCDLVCHSNASPILFNKYLNYQSQKNRSKIREYYFRDKEQHTWAEHVEKIVFENGKVLYTDEYTNLFFTDDIRPSCYNCKYTSLKRCGDFTFADCWGGQDVYPDLVNEKGASLLLVNSRRAQYILESISGDIVIKKIDIQDVMQPRFQKPEKKSKTYNQFWNDYKMLEFSVFMKKYGINNYSIMNVCIKRIKKIIKYPFRIVKRLARK